LWSWNFRTYMEIMGGNDMGTKQQQRAEFALKEVKLLMENGSVEDKLSKLIVSMPNMILSNGLGQSLSFLISKDDGKNPKEVKVFKIIKKYMGNEKQNDLEFLMTINTMDASTYRKKQTEVLKMLEWLKHYARAFAEKK